MIDWARLATATGAPREVADHGKISCLCLTRGNYRHISRAIACFEAQTYPNRELIIVYERLDPEAKRMMLRPTVRQVWRRDIVWSYADLGSLGKKRDQSLELSTGEYFAIWDDDDWHAPRRLELQMAALQRGRPNLKTYACLLENELMFNENTGELFESMRRPWEHSLLCARSLPQYTVRWPDLDRGEDAGLVEDVLRSGWAVLLDMPELYVHTYHGQNAWPEAHFVGMSVTTRSLAYDAPRVAALLDHGREEKRASHLMVCGFCSKLYIQHPLDPTVIGFDGPFLNLLCDGRRVKL